MNREEEMKDLCSGLSLLYMSGNNLEPDEYMERMVLAMEKNDEKEMEHLTALIILRLTGRGKEVPPFALATWEKLFGS